MCGIWGIADINSKMNCDLLLKVIKRLMILSETRGKDASGIAVMVDDHLNILRKAKSSHELLKDKEFSDYLSKNVTSNLGKSIYVAGHSRLVTNGTQYNPNNNQPIAKKNMALVHNGIIVNEAELWGEMPKAHRDYEVDSEAILETYCDRLSRCSDSRKAIDDTYSSIKGMASTIILTQAGHNMIASTNNGSLYCMNDANKEIIIFASEGFILEKLVKAIPELNQIVDRGSIRQLGLGESIIIGDDYQGEISDISIIQDEEKHYSSINSQAFKYGKYDIDFEKIKKLRRCTRCVLPETMPFIEFDEKGVCNYCRGYRKAEYKGEKALEDWKNNFYETKSNAMVSFSGGRDSSYGLHFIVNEMGIKPVAYCYDWGMVTDLARRNQSRMCQQLGVELIVVSADIKKKRDNIRKNVEAWLKGPSLGMIPIFMAGDKQYYYYANKIRTDYNLNSVLMATNPFEKTYFKAGFCGVMPDILKRVYNKLDLERLPASDVIKMTGYYLGQYVKNPRYINSSVIDTFTATGSFYVIPHNYFRLFDYIHWDEKLIDNTLLNDYDWEMAEDSQTTWRIGDGTAPFYNYIYCVVAGLTENDTLRSNQIREGMLSRDEALELVYRDNQPRFDSMKWYFDAINVDMQSALEVINNMKKLY